MTTQQSDDLLDVSRRVAQRTTPQAAVRAAPPWLDNVTSRILSRLTSERVEIVTGSQPSPTTARTSARFTSAALSSVRASGFNGLADSWIRGEWTSEDPARFLERPARLIADLSHNRLLDTASRAYLARTTGWQIGAERHVASMNAKFHYELPTYLFQSFLDESMTYSSAVFDDLKHQDLAMGQWRKRQRLLDLAALGPAAHVLDVGCGWGALLRDLTQAGHRALGITLSVPQADYINELARSAEATFSARVADYRDVESRAYDAVFSVEMIEAVGAGHLDEYFSRLADSLRRGGRLVIQAIVTAPLRVVMTGRRETWIRRHVFPGGQLLSRQLLIDAAQRAGLQLVREHEIGEHYAATLNVWGERFSEAVDDLRSHGASEQFLRMWHFYLSMCKAGFEGGDLQCLQMAFVKSG
jgi:cyclopropane-fatty-acyl-phospholipid synthase